MRMPRSLAKPIELAFNRRHIHDMLLTPRRFHHQRFQPGVNDEGRNRVNQLHFQQFNSRHLIHHQTPGIPAAQINLLHILVQFAFREQVFCRHILRQ